MHVILFNRISSSSNFLGVYAQCETKGEANDVMKKAYAKYTIDKGFDPEFSELNNDCTTAFISSYDMSDYIIMLNVDLDNPVGVDYNPCLEFALLMKRAGTLDD